MGISILLKRLGVLFFIAIALGQTPVLGQDSTSAPSASAIQLANLNQAASQSLWSQWQALMGQEKALEASGATQDQIAAWNQQNASQFASLNQQARALAASSPLPLQPAVVIPSGASPEMTAFLQNQATLANNIAQLHNQTLTSTPGQSSSSPTSANDALLQRQRLLTAILANQEAQRAVPTPPPLVFPPNSSPQMQAFLTARDQLIRSEIQLHNQNLTITPAARIAARLQWEQTNAPLLANLRLLEHALVLSIQTQGGTSE